ncbi:MAG: hypothetical protein GXO32_04545 [Crenarchaeota archaeon]|nr:hypothetical protein [Thermoproteota archaeon]
MDTRLFLKAITYACGSYPKPGAPHRLSLDSDFEYCMITGFAALRTVESLLSALEKLARGSVTLGDLGLGKAMAACVEEASKEIGHRLIVEVALAIPISVLLGWAEQRGEGISIVSRALALAPPDDSRELVEVLHSLGGEYAYDLERADLSPRRVVVEGMSVDDVLEMLGKASTRYRYLKHLDVHGMLATCMRYVEGGRPAAEALAYPFIHMLELEGVKGVEELFEKRNILELLKLDAALRKRGSRYNYLVPPSLYVATLAAARGL